jgi:hypothetical protein
VYTAYHYGLDGLEHVFAVFYPDGEVLGGLPETGLAGFDRRTWDLDPARNSLVGSYTFDGTRVVIVWRNNPALPVSYGVDEHAPDVSGYDRYVPTCQCDGIKFAGSYTIEINLGGNPTTTYDPLTFYPDGTFIDPYGGLDYTLNSHYDRPVAGRGTYVVQDHTILFTFWNGYRIVAGFASPAHQEDDKTFHWIWLQNYLFYERDYRPGS